jgi:hypothetical protein
MCWQFQENDSCVNFYCINSKVRWRYWLLALSQNGWKVSTLQYIHASITFTLCITPFPCRYCAVKKMTSVSRIIIVTPPCPALQTTRIVSVVRVARARRAWPSRSSPRTTATCSTSSSSASSRAPCRRARPSSPTTPTRRPRGAASRARSARTRCSLLPRERVDFGRHRRQRQIG